jgi:hypothetical protein
MSKLRSKKRAVSISEPAGGHKKLFAPPPANRTNQRARCGPLAAAIG